MQDQPWGFTGVFAKENGGGFLDELYPDAYVILLAFAPNLLVKRRIEGTAHANELP